VGSSTGQQERRTLIKGEAYGGLWGPRGPSRGVWQAEKLFGTNAFSGGSETRRQKRGGDRSLGSGGGRPRRNGTWRVRVKGRKKSKQLGGRKEAAGIVGKSS